MNITMPSVVVLAAAVVLTAAGCGDASTSPAATAPTVSSADAPASVGAPGHATPSPSAVHGTTSPADSGAAPNGSGNGLCLDPKSQVAATAVAGLVPTTGGTPWIIESGSDDRIDRGCSGVLSYVRVEAPGGHPEVHLLFFTNGAYLGTASQYPYPYTRVVGKTRDTVSVEYRWPKDGDPLCCPQGASTMTFTLNGTSVEAKGQFPPGK